MALPHPHSRALSSSPAPLFDLNDSADDRLFLHSSPLTASSLASPDHSNSRCSSPHLFEAPRSPLKLSDSVLPMNSLPSFEFASSGAYVNTYSTIHASTNDGAIVLPPSFSATRHSEGLTSPSPAHSLSSQDAFASPFSAVSPYTGTHFAHNRHASAHSSGGAYPPSSPTESSHSHASLIAERDMDSLSAWGRPVDPRAHPRSLEADASHQFAEQLSLKGAFMQSFPPINRSMTVTVSSAAMDRPSSFGRTPSTSSSHSIDSAPELPDSGVPMFINRSFPLPMPVTVASALQLPYSAPRQPEPAYSQHMQWILPNPSMARAQSDPIAYQPPSSVMPPGSNLPAFLTAGPRQPSMSSLPVRGPVQPPPSGPFYERLPVDLLTAPSRSSSKRASPALERVESSSLASAPASRSGSPIAFDESSGDLSPVKRARTRPVGSAPPTPSDLRVLVKSEPVESPMARAPINRQAPRVSPTSAKLPRSRSSNFALSLPKPSSSPPAKDHVRHQGVEKQRRDRTRQLFDALQDFTAARVVGPDDLRAPAEVADPFVCAPIDQPRFVKVQRKGIKLPKEHTLTDALNVLQRQEHELSHYRILTAAVTGPDASLAQRARALLASPAEQVVLCSGCGGSLEQCRLEEALRADSPSGQDSRKAARPARPRPFPQ